MNMSWIRVGEFFNLFGDLFGQRPDVRLVRVPARDVVAADALKLSPFLPQLLEVFEARSRRRNRELRIERQQNQLINPVANDLVNRSGSERAPVTHPDVDDRFNAAPGKFFAQRRGLFLRDSTQRRSAADLSVVARRLFMTSRRDHPRQRLLHRANRQSHDLRVGEEVEEKRAHVGQCFRPAEVEEKNAELHRKQREWGVGSGEWGIRKLLPPLPTPHSPLPILQIVPATTVVATSGWMYLRMASSTSDFVISEISEGYSSRYFTPRPNSSAAASWAAMPALVARPILKEPMIEDCSSFSSSSLMPLAM